MSYSTTVYIGYGVDTSPSTDPRIQYMDDLEDLIRELELDRFLCVRQYGDARDEVFNAVMARPVQSFDLGYPSIVDTNRTLSDGQRTALEKVCTILGIDISTIGPKVFALTT